MAGDNTPGFWVSTSPNAFRNSTYPENPCPPCQRSIGNYCRAPYKITTSGWYTFRHIFKIDPNTQNLSVEFQVVPLGGGAPIVDQRSTAGRVISKRQQAVFRRRIAGSRTRKFRSWPSTTRC